MNQNTVYITLRAICKESLDIVKTKSVDLINDDKDGRIGCRTLEETINIKNPIYYYSQVPCKMLDFSVFCIFLTREPISETPPCFADIWAS